MGIGAPDSADDSRNSDTLPDIIATLVQNVDRLLAGSALNNTEKVMLLRDLKSDSFYAGDELFVSVCDRILSGLPPIDNQADFSTAHIAAARRTLEGSLRSRRDRDESIGFVPEEPVLHHVPTSKLLRQLDGVADSRRPGDQSTLTDWSSHSGSSASDRAISEPEDGESGGVCGVRMVPGYARGELRAVLPLFCF